MEKTLLSIALILVTTRLGAVASRKIGMPEVLGALIAGIVIGPMALSLVTYDESIELLSNIGVILLMFLAGIESDVDQLKKAGKSSFFIALLGVLVPLVLGTLCAFMLGGDLVENIFVGIILTATSISISVETLTELGKLNSRVGVNILGAAVIDDILGLILISMLLAYRGGGSFWLTMLGIGIFCAAGVAAVAFLPRPLNKFARAVRPGRSVLTFALAGAMLLAFVAEKIGIAAITGAYLCGLLLSQYDHRMYLERGVKAISGGFLSLIFFASIGLRMSLSALNGTVILVSLLMFAAAMVSKVIGCGAGARLSGLSRSESVQIGVGMISRGEVAIITANIGLENQIITQAVFIPTLIVVLLTTVATPILMKLTFSHRLENLLLREKKGEQDKHE